MSITGEWMEIIRGRSVRYELETETGTFKIYRKTNGAHHKSWYAEFPDGRGIFRDSVDEGKEYVADFMRRTAGPKP